MCQSREFMWVDAGSKDEVPREDDPCKGKARYTDDRGRKKAKQKDQSWRKEIVKTPAALPYWRLWKITTLWKRTLES